jgi:hypothetical protein
MSMKPLSLEMDSRPLSPSRSLKARDEHEATFSLEVDSRPLSPSRSLKARDEHKATFSGDGLKATVSLSFSQGKR